MLKRTESVVVSFNVSDDPDEELLIVGRKLGGNYNFDILNAMQGPNARALWELLTKQKEAEDA